MPSNTWPSKAPGFVQIDRLDGFAISVQDDRLQLTGANRDLIDRFTKGQEIFASTNGPSFREDSALIVKASLHFQHLTCRAWSHLYFSSLHPSTAKTAAAIPAQNSRIDHNDCCRLSCILF